MLIWVIRLQIISKPTQSRAARNKLPRQNPIIIEIGLVGETSISSMERLNHGYHLFDARITATGEIVLLLSDSMINREYNENVGIHTWCLYESH